MRIVKTTGFSFRDDREVWLDRLLVQPVREK